MLISLTGFGTGRWIRDLWPPFARSAHDTRVAARAIDVFGCGQGMVNFPGRDGHEEYGEEDEGEGAECKEKQVFRGAVGEQETGDGGEEEGA
jgi:hypothetical protein